VRRARRILRTRLSQLPLALLLVGGIIFSMAAGGAFDHRSAAAAYTSSATSSSAGGLVGLKIDAVLTGLYLAAVFSAYGARRLSAPRRARHLLARESDGSQGR
jgi:hypothetical protein